MVLLTIKYQIGGFATTKSVSGCWKNVDTLVDTLRRILDVRRQVLGNIIPSSILATYWTILSILGYFSQVTWTLPAPKYTTLAIESVNSLTGYIVGLEEVWFVWWCLYGACTHIECFGRRSSGVYWFCNHLSRQIEI